MADFTYEESVIDSYFDTLAEEIFPRLDQTLQEESNNIKAEYHLRSDLIERLVSAWLISKGE